MHRHSFFEMHFVVSGSFVFENELSERFVVNSGEYVLFSPKTFHKILSYSEDFVRISLTFLPDEMSFLYKKMSEKGFYKFDISDLMLCRFDELLEEVERKSEFSRILIKNKIFDILCEMFRMADAELTDDGRADNEENDCDIRVEMVKRYIRDNRNVFLTCKDVADQCHFNVKYLNRIFKEQTGMTLLEYIHHEKVVEAERLLSTTELSLEKISQKLGFANEYYFNSFFSRCAGISPGSYRKIRNSKK